MQLQDFDYELPAHLIAQHPTPDRTASRLMCVEAQACIDLTFAELCDQLRPGDLLVLNNTKVIKARMLGTKATGGRAEILFERLLSNDEALCQVRVSKALKPGSVLNIDGAQLEVLGRAGQFYQLRSSGSFLDVLDQKGELPLPPYINRPLHEGTDTDRYQTVYAQERGAVAAPTAGLHFSEALLTELSERGVGQAHITLHVGAGTFQPVRGDLDKHEMHSEYYRIDAQAAEQINRARASGGRIVAVGTTVVRTLESAALSQGLEPLAQDSGAPRGSSNLAAEDGFTQLFITPGYSFRMVDVLVTNFHLPKSTLLMLVSAFAGYERIRNAYAQAIAREYRFFSYGDAMLLHRLVENESSGPMITASSELKEGKCAPDV